MRAHTSSARYADTHTHTHTNSQDVCKVMVRFGPAGLPQRSDQKDHRVLQYRLLQPRSAAHAAPAGSFRYFLLFFRLCGVRSAAQIALVDPRRAPDPPPRLVSRRQPPLVGFPHLHDGVLLHAGVCHGGLLLQVRQILTFALRGAHKCHQIIPTDTFHIRLLVICTRA